jgi:hypothetical protein
MSIFVSSPVPLILYMITYTINFSGKSRKQCCNSVDEWLRIGHVTSRYKYRDYLYWISSLDV